MKVRSFEFQCEVFFDHNAAMVVRTQDGRTLNADGAHALLGIGRGAPA
jgi:hypothetical protein